MLAITQSCTPVRRPAMSRLMNLPMATGAGHPDLGLDQPSSEGLDADVEAVSLSELLGGQGRTEVGIASEDQRQRLLSERIGKLAIARPTPMLRDEALGSFEPQCPAEAFDLAKADPQLLSRLSLRHPSLQDTAECLESVEFLAAHRQASPIVHVGPPARHGGAENPTFLMVRNPTFLNCSYMHTTDSDI